MNKQLRHIALFSQTGSEIADLIDEGIVPDIILFDQKDNSKIDNRINTCISQYIPKKEAKNVQQLKDCFGDPGTCFITLHGWLNIVPKEICEVYDIYNGHPGLITEFPELKGKDPQVKAFNGGYSNIGSVIHHVTPGVDEGEIILTKSVPNKCKTLDEMYVNLKSISLQLWISFFAVEKANHR